MSDPIAYRQIKHVKYIDAARMEMLFRPLGQMNGKSIDDLINSGPRISENDVRSWFEDCWKRPKLNPPDRAVSNLVDMLNKIRVSQPADWIHADDGRLLALANAVEAVKDIAPIFLEALSQSYEVALPGSERKDVIKRRSLILQRLLDAAQDASFLSDPHARVDTFWYDDLDLLMDTMNAIARYTQTTMSYSNENSPAVKFIAKALSAANINHSAATIRDAAKGHAERIERPGFVVVQKCLAKSSQYVA